MYTALYRAYRPEVFGEVLGQQHILQILSHQMERGEINHAYLFSGTRGTGKTTVARLLAKGLNCIGEEPHPCGRCDHCRGIQQGNFMDLIEIDAASNNGVDHIRELRESVYYPPSLGRKKVYIIDEVHMLSSGAFNALLKTLEEPPEHVVFVLATTEPEKLPATILSRCMRMDFRRVNEKEMMAKMAEICEKKEIPIEPAALEFIAGKADGSVRDGLTLLDQCLAGRTQRVTREEVLDTLGAVGIEEYLQLTQAVVDQDVGGGLERIHQFLEKGKDSRQILLGWMEHYRNLLLAKYMKKPEHVLVVSLENIQRLQAQSQALSLDQINGGIIQIARGIEMMRTSSMPRVLLEMNFVKLATGEQGEPSPKSPKSRSMDSPFPPLPDSAPVKKKSPEKAQKTPEQKKPMEEAAAEERKATSSSKLTEEKADNPEKKDRESFWNQFLELGQGELGGMFAMVTNSTKPLEINENEVVVETTAMGRMFIEKNKIKLEEMVEKILGQPHHMVVKDRSESVKERDNLEETAEKAESLLGIPVEIE